MRPGYADDAALRHTAGLVRYLLPIVTDPALPPELGACFGRPFAEVLEGWAELWSFQLEPVQEARALLDTVV